MLIDAFRVYSTPEETLTVWQRQLNYLFLNLDETNDKFETQIDAIQHFLSIST